MGNDDWNWSAVGGSRIIPEPSGFRHGSTTVTLPAITRRPLFCSPPLRLRIPLREWKSTVPAAAFGFRSKYGFGVNWEQEIAKNVGMFGRLGWQDGQTAAAAFTDADWTVQLGLSVKGAAWRRPGDTFGLLR